MKQLPTYAIASVDNALRAATMLQLEGPMKVSDVAQRLGVATSTAHRLLAMLVYRDFAVRGPDRTYRVGPVLELPVRRHSDYPRLREAAMPHLHKLVDTFDESANLIVQLGAKVRFIGCVESSEVLRVCSREGMAFPAHLTSVGLTQLAKLSDAELARVYEHERNTAESAVIPDLDVLHADLDKVRRNGFGLNRGLSEKGVIAIGVALPGPKDQLTAGISLSLPEVRYDKHQLPRMVAALHAASAALEHDLAAAQPEA